MADIVPAKQDNKIPIVEGNTGTLTVKLLVEVLDLLKSIDGKLEKKDNV